MQVQIFKKLCNFSLFCLYVQSEDFGVFNFSVKLKVY